MISLCRTQVIFNGKLKILLNTAANWTLEFTANPFAVEDGTLTITTPDGTAMVLTRMEE